MIVTYVLETNHLLREGLKSFLADTNFMVTTEIGCMSDLCADLTAISAPDLIIAGANKSRDDRFEKLLTDDYTRQIHQLRDRFPSARLVIMGSAEEIGRISELSLCNADGYILRDISREAILNYLNLAMMGEKVLPESVALLFVAMRLKVASSLAPAPANGIGNLSGRENDIAQCLVLGHSNKLIAKNLEITESTVKVHLKTILRKMGVQNRTQAALLAFKQNNGHTEKSGEFIVDALVA